MTVLVTDGGNGQNRSAVAAVRALAAAGHPPVVTVSGPLSLAAASRRCAGAVTVPPVGDPGYADAVRAEVARAGHVAVLPASDAALVALGHPGAALVDKAELSRRVAAAGLPVLPERRFAGGDELRAAAGELEYPLVVKPEVRTSAAQPPVRRVASAADLRAMPDLDGALLVQPFVDAPMSAVSGVVWRGELVALVAARYLRLWPVDAGVACALETVPPDPALEGPLTEVLRGHDGVFQAQLVGRYVVDLNPRVYGSLPLAVSAGANLPGLVADLSAGQAVRPVRGRAGVRYRWLEGDVRHALVRRARGEAGLREMVGWLRPRRGTAHSIESLTDPGPVVARLRHALSTRGAAT